MDSDDDPAALDEAERAAVHEVELGLEWLRRAHGHLVQFHHATGHAMDHLDDAEGRLRELGRTELADAIRYDHLPRGVIDDDRWSYDVLEEFEAGVLADLVAFERAVRDELTDGRRHAAERAQERRWKRRAREWSRGAAGERDVASPGDEGPDAPEDGRG